MKLNYKRILSIFLFSAVSLMTLYANPYSDYIGEEDYLYFWSLVTNFFENESVEIIPDLDDGSLQINQASEYTENPLYSFVNAKLNMDNLIYNCLQHEKSEWEGLVNSHFQRIKDSIVFEKEKNELIKDFDAIKGDLKVKIYPLSYEPYLENAIYQSFIPETFSAVVFDYPFAVKITDRNLLDEWGRTEQEVFEIALKNSLNLEEHAIQEFMIQGGYKIKGIFGESFFVATGIYDLYKKKDLQGEYGTIYIVPSNSAVLFYPIENNEALTSVSVQFMLMADQIFQSGVGSISPQLYWLYKEKFYLVEQNRELGMINYPDEYKELLNN